jgi:hypothetical protein
VSSFEYVMVLVSIVIGLAITHLLIAFSAAIHRLRGHGDPIRLEPVYLLWTGFVLIWLISFWWWEFKLQDVGIQWSYGIYLFIVAYAISLFLLAAILVPKGMAGVNDSYVFFMEGRKWFFGALLVVLGIDVMDTFLKGYDYGVRPAVLIQYGVIAMAAVVGILSRRRGVQLAAAATAFTAQLVYMFQELGVLGSFGA